MPRREATAVAPSALRPVPRRGLRREEAAIYIGVSVSKFDTLVRDGRMPPSFAIDGCRVWDIRAVDAAFDELARAPERIDTWADVV